MTKKGKTNIGLFGGTFNPIHYGHLRVAEEIRAMVNLEEIYFIPAFIPPHKENDNLIDPDHRFKMVELAIGDNSYFRCSDVEILRQGISYTIDTLEEFRDQYASKNLYFLVGNEIFHGIESWREYNRLFDLSNFIVYVRPGYKKISDFIPSEIIGNYKLLDEGNEMSIFTNEKSKLLIILRVNSLNISSTTIRDLVKINQSVRYLVPDVVEQYIIFNNLYV